MSFHHYRDLESNKIDRIDDETFLSFSQLEDLYVSVDIIHKLRTKIFDITNFWKCNLLYLIFKFVLIFYWSSYTEFKSIYMFGNTLLKNLKIAKYLVLNLQYLLKLRQRQYINAKIRLQERGKKCIWTPAYQRPRETVTSKNLQQPEPKTIPITRKLS